MDIRKTTAAELCSLMNIFDEARETIRALGINQWQNGYPSESVVLEDIALGRSYVVDVDGEIVGTFVLMENGEPTYDKIYDGHWKTGDENQSYVAMHRVAIAVKKRGSGISSAMVGYAESHARRLGCESLRIDTHEGNVVMRRMLEKHGFEYCGIIYLQSGDPRVAYERVLQNTACVF
ncbi:MAG: GNAT family N-acetyltransferase [Ruminococcaceae bacterium]|nr:GNAT family N-acetyltransferase [Oscillospiraceae bacterium]